MIRNQINRKKISQKRARYGVGYGYKISAMIILNKLLWVIINLIEPEIQKTLRTKAIKIA